MNDNNISVLLKDLELLGIDIETPEDIERRKREVQKRHLQYQYVPTRSIAEAYQRSTEKSIVDRELDELLNSLDKMINSIPPAKTYIPHFAETQTPQNTPGQQIPPVQPVEQPEQQPLPITEEPQQIQEEPITEDIQPIQQQPPPVTEDIQQIQEEPIAEDIQPIQPQPLPESEEPQQIQEVPIAEDMQPIQPQPLPESEEPQQIQEEPIAEDMQPIQLQPLPESEEPKQIQEEPATEDIQPIQQQPVSEERQEQEEILPISEEPQQLSQLQYSSVEQDKSNEDIPVVYTEINTEISKKVKRTGKTVEKPISTGEKVREIIFNILIYGMIAVLLIGSTLFALSSDPNKACFGYRIYNVLSNSMKDNDGTHIGGFEKGDLIVVKIIKPDEIRVGDIVTYNRGIDRYDYLTHRVVEILESYNGQTGLYVVTQGDANNFPDNPIIADMVVGKKVLVIPRAGDFLKKINENLILVIFIIIISFILIKSLNYLFRKNKVKEEETNADTY